MNYIRHLNEFFALAKHDHDLTAAHVSLYMALFQAWNSHRFQNPFPIQRDDMMQLSKIGSKNTYHKCLRHLHLAKYILHHTQLSKFQHIKISMLRFDYPPKNEELQLNIFDAKKDDVSCTEIDTDSVPYLTDMCPKSGTVCVPNVGRYYNKLNIKHINSVQKTHTEIFHKNEKIQEAINGFAGHEIKVMKSSVPAPVCLKSDTTSSCQLSPTKIEIANFFRENKYPITEAAKFFYYNQSKAWMLTDKIAINDWQPLAHKWMLKENAQSPQDIFTNYQTSNAKDYTQPL